jgi:chaperone LolA
MKRNIIAFILISTVAFAQSGSEILKKVQNKFRSIDDFTANFVQSYGQSNDSKTSNMSGKFFYKRKNKFVVELSHQTITCDGKIIWNYDGRFKRVVISNVADDPTSFLLEKFIFDYPPHCNVSLVKDKPALSGEKILELIPKDQTMQFKSVYIWVSKQGLISRMDILDRGDINYTFQFSDFKLDQNLPDTKFIYYPPKGIKVIDLR